MSSSDDERPSVDPRSSYMRDIYIGGVQDGSKPQTTQYPLLRQQAQKILPPGAFYYVDGSAGTETAEHNNRSAFARWDIVPRMLAGVDVSSFDMSVRAFGRWFPTPIVISPIGVQGQLHADADYATARAARELGVPFTLSSATSRPMENVIDEGGYKDEDQEPGQEAWFQLYWPNDEEVTASLLSRAKKAGYKVLVVTLDTWSLGWRPRDLDTAYNPFLTGEGVANLFSDPVFIEKYCEGKSPLAEGSTQDDVFSASISCIGLMTPGLSRSWEELAHLRELWGDDPIVLKGVVSPEDAKLAMRHGMDGVWVSNHGGRQVDGSVASLQGLESIAAVLRGVEPVGRKWGKPVCIFDSGVRCGADIFKAKALGADLIGIGRPYAWGLTVGGEDGVRSVLKALLADFELNSALAGCRGIEDATRDRLVRRGQKL